MRSADELANKLTILSCDRMCDGGKWGTRDHKLLIDALDALREERRLLRASASAESKETKT